MRPQVKAGVWIGATFVVGTAFGMVLNGALSDRSSRAATVAAQPNDAGGVPPNGDRAMRANGGDPRGPARFVAQMERVVQPHDETQRNQLRPFFEATDRANRASVDGARRSMAAALDSLRAAINPLLDDSQRQRLAQFGGPPPGEATPGLGGRGMPPGGMPPDGRGRGRGRGRGGAGRPEGPPPK